MTIRLSIYIASMITLLSLSGCGLPALLMGGMATQDIYAPEPYLEEGDFAEEDPRISQPKEEAPSATEPTASDPPVVVIAGTPSNTLYANVSNKIKIYTPSGNTSHLQITTQGGRLTPIDEKNGLYNFVESHAGVSVDILVRDTISGLTAGGTYSVVSIPAPEALLWQYRKPLNKKATVPFDAKRFKEQSAIVLDFGPLALPLRCSAGEFTIVHIPKEGKRTTYENVNPTGSFDKEAQALINKAQKGDIYIFKDIKATCTNERVKDVVYFID